MVRCYRDCQCPFGAMSATVHTCVYVTLDEMKQQQQLRSAAEGNKGDQRTIFRQISKHDIANALTEDHMPLSDGVHGPYKMAPPELLHVSGNGIVKYVLREIALSLQPAQQVAIDELHQQMWHELVRQSKRDYPIGSVRNGLLDGTKRKASEFVGDLFILACVAHTSAGKKALAPYLAMWNISVKRFISAITDYLCMIT